MSSYSMSAGLIDAAEALLMGRPDSAEFRRRAVSTLYYAVFHRIAALCADSLVPGAAPTDMGYLRVYRALDHGQLVNSLIQAPLKDHPIFRTAGLWIIKLKEERHSADYLPSAPDLFPPDAVRSLLDQARLVLETLENLQPCDRRLLATCLLFKERKS